MVDLNVIPGWLPVLMAVGAIVVWAIRVEGEVGQLKKLGDIRDKEIEALDVKLNTFDSKLLAKLSEIAERLSYIEGSLRKGNDE